MRLILAAAIAMAAFVIGPNIAAAEDFPPGMFTPQEIRQFRFSDKVAHLEISKRIGLIAWTCRIRSADWYSALAAGIQAAEQATAQRTKVPSAYAVANIQLAADNASIITFGPDVGSRTEASCPFLAANPAWPARLTETDAVEHELTGGYH